MSKIVRSDVAQLKSPGYTSVRSSLRISTEISADAKLYPTKPISWRGKLSSGSISGSQQPDEFHRADKCLVKTVLTSASFAPLTLTEVKKTDRHGCIYEAKQLADEMLFEVKVYSFERKGPNEKQYMKRNCREWKKRRRFIVSHQENGFLFLILHHPKTTVPATSSDEIPSLLPHSGRLAYIVGI